MPTIHNPTNFKPEDYEVFGYFDNRPPEVYFGESPEHWEVRYNSWKDELTYAFGELSLTRKCVHCGAGNVRYVVSCTHVPTGKRVCFGDICVNRLNFRNQDEFKASAIRKKAAHEAARFAVAEKVRLLCEADPTLSEVISLVSSNHEGLRSNSFSRDVVSKLFQYGSISDRQRECLIESVKKSIDRFNNPPPPEPVPTSPAPEGRCAVDGEIVFTKCEENVFGSQWKMLIRLDSGAKVWCSVPTGLGIVEELRGKRTRVTATWTRKAGDTFFAFGKRPHGHLLETVQQEIGC